jgi:hypothetical protein
MIQSERYAPQGGYAKVLRSPSKASISPNS